MCSYFRAENVQLFSLEIFLNEIRSKTSQSSLHCVFFFAEFNKYVYRSAASLMRLELPGNFCRCLASICLD